MNGRLIAGAVLVLLIVVGGIFVLIGVLRDAGSNTDDPGDGTLRAPVHQASWASPALASDVYGADRPGGRRLPVASVP